MTNNIAIIFPGQGSQYVGMGKDLYNNYSVAKQVFDQFDQVVGRSISGVSFDGPEEELKQTINTQPAIVATSIAAYEVLKSQLSFDISFVAGHSLGEYAALYAAGVLDVDSVAALVKKRAELMDNAPKGSMLAVLNLDSNKLDELIKDASNHGIITVANYNTPDQVVISGENAAIQRFAEKAKEAGAKRVIHLPVSGAFHSPLMQEASNEFSNEVTKYSFNDASIPVITNVDAEITKTGFANQLVKQIYSSVLWTQTLQVMTDSSIDTFIEVGPGKVLSGMVKKFNRKLKVYNVSDVNTLESVVSQLQSTICV